MDLERFILKRNKSKNRRWAFGEPLKKKSVSKEILMDEFFFGCTIQHVESEFPEQSRISVPCVKSVES